METPKEFEAFENAIIKALNNRIISINDIQISEGYNLKFKIDIEYPCPNLLLDIYQKKMKERRMNIEP